MTNADLLRPESQALTGVQENALDELLTILRTSNVFYSRRLANLGGLLRASAFFDIPFTLKADLSADQASSPPFGSNLTFSRSSYTRLSHTSGTNSAPLYWLDTEESWGWMVANWSRIYGVADVTASDTVFFAFSFGPFLGFWTAFEAATKLGALAVPSGGLTSLARLQKLIELEATVLCCTPTYAVRLALTAEEYGIDLTRAKVSRIIVAGECGGSLEGIRRRIENLWNGARLIDHYGMTEVGPAGYSCPCNPDILHIMNDRYISEVVHRAMSPEDLGELVLTPLGRTGSPVLRYRTGDLVRPASAAQCICGSNDLALQGGILGRCDDMVVVRGVNVFPMTVEQILSNQGVFDYQIDIHEERGMTEMRIRIDRSGGETETRIQQALHAALGLRVEVSHAPSGTLVNSDGKSKRWIRHS